MARQIGKLQEWLNMDQAAEYLGVTKRSVVNAIELVKSNQGNKELKIKRFGNRWLVSRTSLDKTCSASNERCAVTWRNYLTTTSSH